MDNITKFIKEVEKIHPYWMGHYRDKRKSFVRIKFVGRAGFEQILFLAKETFGDRLIRVLAHVDYEGFPSVTVYIKHQ